MRLRRKSKGLSWPFPWVENIHCLNSSKATKTKKERFENLCSDIRPQRSPRKPSYVAAYIYIILEENLGAGFWDHAYKLMNELCKLMYVWATGYIYILCETILLIDSIFWSHAYKLMNELCKLMYVWATGYIYIMCETILLIDCIFWSLVLDDASSLVTVLCLAKSNLAT